jgi:RNA polymerase sigma factor (TIGR02999 family)
LNVELSGQPHELTRLLQEMRPGEADGFSAVLPLVYQELHRLAHRHLRSERSGHTLNTTALVHEAFLNLVDQRQVQWQNRAHFFAIAARMMRRILLGYARKRAAGKRGGGVHHQELDESLLLSDEDAEELIAFEDVLARLEQLDGRLGQIVEYRYFAGLTIDEVADVLAISPATVKRDWRTARAWLLRELGTGA